MKQFSFEKKKKICALSWYFILYFINDRAYSYEESRKLEKKISELVALVFQK